MSIWTKDKAPAFKKDAVATNRGWENPKTKEILVAIRGLAEKAGSADVNLVSFAATALEQGDALAVKVRFNERVNVTAGASLLVTTTGVAGTIQLFAAQQLSVQEVLFNFQVDLVTPVVVPAETADLSIATQTIAGTVEDALGSRPYSNLVISVELASAAGVRVIA